MHSILASEGGFQLFELGGTEKSLLWFAVATSIVAMIAGAVMMKNVLAKDTGTPEMGEIAGAVQEGAMAYITRQFRTIGVIVIPLAAVVFFTSSAVARPDGATSKMSGALSFAESGAFRTGAFIVGAVASGFIGFLGMWLSTRANLRTATAAKTGSMNDAMRVAFRAGGTVGMFTAGLGLLGATLIVLLFRNSASAILIGFGFGGSLLALFLRVGGGIFTKAADVGADLVGKVEAGIPEDDPRNPATIADNVGDNVGDCAGMAADLFESFGVTLVASIILGVSSFKAIGLTGTEAAKGLIFPLVIMAIGLLASIIAIWTVRARPGETDALKPINRGLIVASILALGGTAVVAFGYIGDLNTHQSDVTHVGTRMFFAIVAGVILGQVASRVTQYYTSSQFKPVKDIAAAGETGPATVVLSGISSGMESAVWAVIAVGGAILAAVGLGGGNLQFGLYLVALTGIGVLSTTAIVVAEDTFGPIADNAQGIAEMAGELEGETEKILDGLDTVGNTTKAVTKGFAIGSAVIAAVALFATYRETIAENSVKLFGELRGFKDIALNIADPKVFVGGLIAGGVVYMFSSLSILAVSRTAGTVVQEVRRQFADGKIMSGERRPDYGPVVDICTTAALRELATPALLAVLVPVIVGFSLGAEALGGYLASAIIVGALMANFLSNAGGAWDNAKKYIEEGNHGGKGSDHHTAVVIGDTVGDPFKDTAGPAINPLIKVMNLVALLVLPAVISLNDKTGQRYAIAAVALVVVLGAVVFSKKSGPKQITADA